MIEKAKNKKVMVGMSGGVDSSVAAALLLKAGYDVIGITMKIYSGENSHIEREGGCCSLSSVEDARAVANKLSIPFYVMNFEDYFKETVIENFIDEYKNGRTPNPCIMCNRYVKFDALLNKALAMGIDYIATGHYAKIEKDEKSGRFLLKRSDFDRKDQTYALYNMTQHQLAHTLMPLGTMDKAETRSIAKELGLSVADKPDSQEICFVEDDNYARFIQENSDYKPQEGNFVDEKGNVLGKHKGIIYYTIGQRKGLGMTFGRPMFVTKICPDDNSIVLGENDSVFSHELIACDTNFIPFDGLKGSIDVFAKIRYSAPLAPATVYPMENGSVRVAFTQPARAITPGQSVVFYDKDNIVIGGGRIV